MKLSDIRYGFYVLTHPMDGFWDLKYEKRGRLSVCFLFLSLWVLTNIYESAGMAFLFNTDYGVPVNLVAEARNIGILFVTFCAANWSVTTLLEGKGFFRDIAMVFGYSSLVMTLIRFPVVLLSHVAAQSETGLINGMMILSWALFFTLLFLGTMMIHDFTLGKAVGSAVLTIASMIILLFIAIVFYNIFSQLYAFALAVYKELQLRM